MYTVELDSGGNREVDASNVRREGDMLIFFNTEGGLEVQVAGYNVTRVMGYSTVDTKSSKK